MPSIPPVRPDAKAPAEIRNAIRQASARTGVSYDYLAAQAKQESGFRTDARASSSSAAVLYQFVESTWLAMIREHGAKYRVGDLARAITIGPDQRPRVADDGMRAQILALRDDPDLSAAMAAEYARANHERLTQALGREIGATDLYLAHFLGPAGATRLLETLDTDPQRSAADLLPEAAAANRAVFFDTDGRARSVGEIYDRFAAKFDPHHVDTPGSRRAPGIEPLRVETGAPVTGETHALDAVMRRAAAAMPAENVLSPTVVAALAALDLPETGGQREQHRPRETR
jgi:hypothetical protein